MDPGPEPTPNMGIRAGTADAMQRIHETLKGGGILVPYMPAYSGIGPEGKLRISVCATHTDGMIDRLLAALGAACRLMPVL